MLNRSRPVAIRVSGLLTLAALLTSPAWAQEAQPAGREVPAILDEYNADASIGADFQRLAVGLTFGDVRASGFWWYYGARAGSIWLDNGKVDEQGWVLGGVIGLGFDPSKKVSPVAGLALDYPFGVGGKVDLIAQIHAGARIRLSQDPEHFALTVAAFTSGLFLGDGLADDSDAGIAVLFSAASLRPR